MRACGRSGSLGRFVPSGAGPAKPAEADKYGGEPATELQYGAGGVDAAMSIIFPQPARSAPPRDTVAKAARCIRSPRAARRRA